MSLLSLSLTHTYTHTHSISNPLHRIISTRFFTINNKVCDYIQRRWIKGMCGIIVGGLPLGDALCKRKIASGFCFFCMMEVEHNRHRFISCPVTKMVWKFINAIWMSLTSTFFSYLVLQKGLIDKGNYWSVMKQVCSIPSSKPFCHILHPTKTQIFAFLRLLELIDCFTCELRKLMSMSFLNLPLVFKNPFHGHDLDGN